MAEYDRCHRAVLSQGGQWPTALSAGDHAAYSLHAALVQPERRCHGRCPVRNRLHAPVCPIIPDSAPPDRTTIMNFRHLLEQHQLARQLFKTINRWLAEAGVMMTQGTLVDATIIEAPSSTKNKEQQRDPEMHQTKKGNQWHFGMKAHIGVDAKSGLTHSLVTTAANEHDLNQLGNLLHGEEQFVSADAGYQGAPQREELAEVDVDWLIAERPGKVKTLKQHPRKNKTAINIEYMKASIRAKVEHPFRIIKRQFGFVKARYKGLLKNDNQLAMLFTPPTCFGWTK